MKVKIGLIGNISYSPFSKKCQGSVTCTNCGHIVRIRQNEDCRCQCGFVWHLQVLAVGVKDDLKGD